ncbi:hypothetical protein CY35_19G001100 [Sphagnum magellanicum]|nr:hypothetical protein CY35_19G001100 [Sphagnum magellanicum]
MECFESLNDAKKKISADLSSKNPQYQVIPFTSSTRPSDNKLWERMGQVVVKATGQWVCFDVPVELDGKARTKRMYVSQQTIKRRTMDRSEKGIVKLQGIVHNHFQDNGRASFSTDIWTDDTTQTAYSANTMHLIDVNFIMHARVMSCDEFNEGTNHTAAAIHREFLNNVHPFITWKEENMTVQAANWQVVIKSDAVGNNRGAEGMSSQFELDLCYCHRISIVINYVLRKQTRQVDGVEQAPVYLFYDESPFVYDTIDASKELVTYMKQMKLNKQLKNKMKQDSVFAKLDESTELLKKRKQENRTEKIFEELLDELIPLLHYFKLANKSLEPFNTPTLHLVDMWLAKRKAHLQPRDEPVTVNGAHGKKMTIPADSESIAPINVRLLEQLEEKFFFKPLHVVVAYLDPLQKNRLKDYGSTQELIDQGLVYLKDIMRKVGPPKPPAASMSDGMQQRPPVIKKNFIKRPRTVFVHESEDDAEQAEESQLEAHIDQELAEYRLFKASKNDKEVLLQPDTRKRARKDGDSDKFPILTRAVCAILCIPTSSSMSECTFSSAGNTCSNKRNGLHPSTLNALLFLCSNQDLDRK